jgi:hypothetical protein
VGPLSLVKFNGYAISTTSAEAKQSYFSKWQNFANPSRWQNVATLKTSVWILRIPT